MKVKINNKEYEFQEELSILDAVRKAHIIIPTLCYSEKLKPFGSCRLCSVEIKGERTLKPACVTKISDGMEIYTHSEKVRKVRSTVMELIIASHGISCNLNCLTCPKSSSCEIKVIAEEIGIMEVRIPTISSKIPEDRSSYSIVREPQKCIVCDRCVRKCAEVQSVNILTIANRGPDTYVTTFLDKGMGNVDCVNCGQCVIECPTGALHEVYQTDQVWNVISDNSKYVIVQTAPAVRVAIAEEFGAEPGRIVTKQLVAGLRLLGFDKVFDTNFAADLTIMEEASEFLERFKNGGKLPLFTSCSPGWIKFIEHNYPEFLDNLSTCKSPQQMFGAIAKTYYADKIGIPREDMIVVSIMPCTAKKYERVRPEMKGDVDYVLTTRELAKMFKLAGIDLLNLPSEEYDEPLGITTGAAAIFGATGGVMEAALRTAYEVITGKNLERLDFESVRGIEGIKEAVIEIDGLKLNVAVVNGLGNARKMLDMIKNGEKDYHFIEFMACPGGCIGGGGQPIPTTKEILSKRMKAIYEIDKSFEIRKSHENPAIQALYKEFLGEPLSEKSHELLHTTYIARS
ncbi:MAG: NADH-dependent [FeFe] hydrogenase, group A6 [Defluviitoga tunisiensis]